jgi:hypothetical protein
MIMTLSSSPQVTLLRVQRAPSSIWKRRSPCSSACCPAEALRAVTIDHDDVAIASGDVAACAAAPSSIWKRKSPCSSACCPAEALRAVTNDHDDVIIATGDGAACAAGAELDLEAKEPM